MVNVLFINTNISWNKGSAAQVTSVIDDLNKVRPGLDFSLVSYCVDQDSAWSDHMGIRVTGYATRRPHGLGYAMLTFSARLLLTLVLSTVWRFLNRFGIKSKLLMRERFLREFAESDIVIDLSGDSFSDKGSHSFVNMLSILIAVMLKKPLIFYSQSIGPFNRFSKRIARLCMNRSNVITVRERITRDYLVRMGVRQELIQEYGDCAFTMTPAEIEHAKKILTEEGVTDFDAPIIGLSVSALISDISREQSQLNRTQSETDAYLDLVLRIVNRLTAKGITVVLISHVIAQASWMRDDRVVCNEIRRRALHKERVFAMNNDYAPEVIKSIIRSFDFFIGSRMHACIAALSTNVPTIALGWSHKYDGIMNRLDMAKYSYAFSELNEDAFMKELDEFIDHRDEIKESLKIQAGKECDSAREGIKVIVNLIDATTRGPS